MAKSLCSFINSKRLSGAHLVDEVFFHVLSVFGVRISHEPKALDAGVLNRMATGVEMYGDRFVPVVDDVCQVFLESGFQGAARLTNVEFGTLGTVDHVDEVVCLTIEVLCHSHPRTGASDVGGSADEGADLAVRSAAGSCTWRFLD